MELLPRGVQLFEWPVAELKKGSYSETRGFLYMLSAAAIAQRLGARRLLVTECGPTMYQIRFAATDKVTMTTHPFVIDRVREILDTYLTTRLAIETPFADNTKAEVMCLSPDRNIFPITHSCISQRLPLQDGTCYGCIVRRLAALASGTPDVIYARDPITDEAANAGNLLSLLEFSSALLLRPEELSLHQRDFLTEHDKWSLYKRFALDNFAGVFIAAADSRRLARPVAVYLDEVLAGLGKETLVNRITDLKKIASSVTGREEKARELTVAR
jgi:hypothetical protein